MKEQDLFLLHEDTGEYLCIDALSYRKYCEINKLRSLSQRPELEIQCNIIDSAGKKTEKTLKLKVNQLKVYAVLRLQQYNEPGWHTWPEAPIGSNLIKTSWPNIY